MSLPKNVIVTNYVHGNVVSFFLLLTLSFHLLLLFEQKSEENWFTMQKNSNARSNTQKKYQNQCICCCYRNVLPFLLPFDRVGLCDSLFSFHLHLCRTAHSKNHTNQIRINVEKKIAR